MPGYRGRYVVARQTSYQGFAASQGDAEVAPNAITVNNGTELISKALDEWAYRNNVRLHFIEPGKRTFGNIVPSRCVCNVARDKFGIAVFPGMNYPT